MQRKLITTLLCCFAVVFSSCMKETGETILLPVKGSKIPLSVLTEEMQAELADHMPIHEGDTPPDISGTYLTSPMYLIYASDGYSNEFYDMRWQVDAIDWWNSTTYFEWQNTASGSAIEAHLIGTGDSFTLYTIDHVVNDTDGWSCELITVVSGKKVTGGIANYFAEQAIWVCFYLFSIGAGMGVFNWSVIGALLLLVLFQGSSSLAEEISAGKYPEYERYCQSVPRFFPGKRYEG